jgi:hypothetical protein
VWDSWKSSALLVSRCLVGETRSALPRGTGAPRNLPNQFVTSMKRTLFVGWLAWLIFATGCAHNPSGGSVLILNDPNFTRVTEIDRLIVIPREVPEVKISVRKAGQYRCRIWSETRRKVRTCLADSHTVEVQAPQQIDLVSTHRASVWRQDYWVEIEYVSSTGESARLFQLIAAWW